MGVNVLKSSVTSNLFIIFMTKVLWGFSVLQARCFYSSTREVLGALRCQWVKHTPRPHVTTRQ